MNAKSRTTLVTRVAHARTLVIALCGAAALGGLVAVAASSVPRPVQPVRATETQVTRVEVAKALGEIGLSPEELAAVGLTAADVTALVQNLLRHINDHLPAWRDAESQKESRLQARADRERQKQDNRSAAERTTAAFESGPEVATTTVEDGRFAAARLAALSELNAKQVALLAQLRVNNAREVPVQYRVVERTDQQWIELRDALANLRHAGRIGVDSDVRIRLIVTEANSQPAVAAASAALENGKDEVRRAWQNALRAIAP